jgi:hypothetical protein
VAERRRRRRIAGVGRREAVPTSRATPAIGPTRRAAARCCRPVRQDGHAADGETVVVDEAYIRESILNPQAKIVAGFQPIMPTFQGLVSEEQLLQLIEYVKSLKGRCRRTRTADKRPRPPRQGEEPTRKDR